MELIISLWYIHKVKVYEASLIKATKAVSAIRVKQRKFTAKQEHYAKLVAERTKVK